ncbi:MAG: glycosyltransferase family 39 protein [Elusimicrobia bacterium]|nr:glycosyltransferase family 39 protein [Elusimicrobiota bacterium]
MSVICDRPIRRAALVAVLLTLGAAARVGYAVLFPPGGRGSPMPDLDGYVGLGASVAGRAALLDEEGRPSALREPVYPILLGAAFKPFGVGLPAVVLVNLLLNLAALLVLMRIGDELFGPETGLAALAIGAFYPAFIFYTAQPLRESALTLASTGCVAMLLRAGRLDRPGPWAAAGAASSLAALLNTVYLPFGLVVAPLGALIQGRREPRKAVLRCAAFLAAFLACYAAWPARNYAQFGRFILGSTAAGGSSFYTYLIVPQELGGLPEQTAIARADPVAQAALGLDRAERESYFWRAGLKKVAQEPLRFLRLAAWRFFIDIWRIVPRDRPGAQSHGRRLLVAASVLSDGWLLPAAAAGVLLAGASAPGVFWGYALVASVNAVYSLVLTSIRYRVASMPWVILLAAYALVRLLSRRAGPSAATTGR